MMIGYISFEPSFKSSVQISQSHSASKTVQMKYNQSSLDSPQDDLITLTSDLTQHLKNFLDIRWNIPRMKCEGKVQLDCSKWGKDLLLAMVAGPLSFGKFCVSETGVSP